MKKYIVRAYWPSFRKYWLLWLITLISMMASVICQTLTPYYARGIMEALTSTTPDVPQAQTLLWKTLWATLGIVLAYRIFDIFLALHESFAMANLDRQSFHKIQRQSMRFFEDAYAGSLVTQARRFRASYELIIDLFFFQFGRNAVMLMAISIAFLKAMPRLTAPFVIWAGVFIIYSYYTAKWKYRYDKKTSETDSKVGASLTDSLTNHWTVKTFGQEVTEEFRFSESVQKNHQARLHSWLLGDVILIGQVLIVTGAEMAVIWWMVHGWSHGTVTAGEFIFVQTLIAWAVNHLWPFGHNLQRLFTAVADAEEMAQIYDLEPEVRDAPGAHPLRITNGDVEFYAVEFRYNDTSRAALNAISNLSLTIPAGQAIGLVGYSGAGKSTLIKLLLRFYDLDSGYIRIDGQDIANVTQISLRQQLAMVPQHSQLFHRSIRDNIAFGRPHATEAEIIYAAQQAYAWDFIQKLPQGLDTLVGERGVKLSGGQQQRVAIARAILADPKILLLDEATSSLDSITEKLIQKAIANLLLGRTAIVIAHRLSTIMQLDQIIVMDEGQIIETGTHEELLNLNGVYADLWSHQSGGYLN